MAAREALLRRASEISDPHARQNFLSNVPKNAKTLALAGLWRESRPKMKVAPISAPAPPPPRASKPAPG